MLQDVAARADDLRKLWSDAIFDSTNFRVEIVVKKHNTFVDIVRCCGAEVASCTPLPPWLLENGRCIAAAAHRVKALTPAAEEKLKSQAFSVPQMLYESCVSRSVEFRYCVTCIHNDPSIQDALSVCSYFDIGK